MNLNNNHSFNIELAQLVGVEKALLLGRVWLYIDYHKKNGTNNIDGRYWMYDSSSALAEVYPYMNEGSIRRRMIELEREGWIISGNYNRKSNDLTKWYALGPVFNSWIKDGNKAVQNERANLKDANLSQNTPVQNERLNLEEEESVISPVQNVQSIVQNARSIVQNERPLPIISQSIPIVAVGETTAPTKSLSEEEIEEWIKLRYRHYFRRAPIDIHFQADVGAIHREILKTYTQDITQNEVLEIVDRAFERVLQEKPKKDWVTREVIVRINWGLQDFFKAKEKEAAKQKSEAIKNLKPGDPELWNPNEDNAFKELLNKKMFDDKQEKKDEKLDKNSLEYRRKQSLFNQAISEGK